MFSQRRSLLKGKLFYIILLGLFLFGIWLNQSPVDNNPQNEISTDSDYPVSSKGAINPAGQDGYDILDNIIGGGTNMTDTPSGIIDSESGDNQNSSNSDYYLVKEVNGIIKIFYYDEFGKETFIKDTDIAFSILSVADQELFRKGVIKLSTEELDELLQDFES